MSGAEDRGPGPGGYYAHSPTGSHTYEGSVHSRSYDTVYPHHPAYEEVRISMLVPCCCGVRFVDPSADGVVCVLR